jgi:drug/metabolite transporter (DMT)-like permease
VTPRQAGLLAALAAIWGGAYLLIKYGLEDLEAGVIVWGRCAVATIVLAAVLRGRARPALAEFRRRPARAFLLGLLTIALPFALITFGELEVPSGLTAVLIAPMSIFVAMLAPLLDHSERADARAGFGMALGLAGVALLVGVESVQSLGEFLGALAILGSALSYALGSFVVKRYGHLSPTASSLVSVATATVLATPLALWQLPDAMPGARALLSVVALGVLMTAVAFVIYYRLIAEVGAGRASLVSYLAPAVALGYGAALLDEPITPAAIGGLAMILAGVALASRRRAAVLD